MDYGIEKTSQFLPLLPYIQRYSGKTFVIKCGGSALTEEVEFNNMMNDIAFLHSLGIHIVLIHGGGPDISQMCTRLNVPTRFVNGYRVTDKATMEIAQMVLVGKTNRTLVTALNKLGTKSVGMSGQDSSFITVKQRNEDLGFVGDIVSVEKELIETLIHKNYIPVISPIGVDESGQSYNINADIVAGAIAGALVAEKLIILSDVNGVYENIQDPSSRIESLPVETAKKWLEEKLVDGGMIPKLEACLIALDKGVEDVRILDGKMRYSLLLEIYTTQGIGTRICK